MKKKKEVAKATECLFLVTRHLLGNAQYSVIKAMSFNFQNPEAPLATFYSEEGDIEAVVTGWSEIKKITKAEADKIVGENPYARKSVSVFDPPGRL